MIQYGLDDAEDNVANYLILSLQTEQIVPQLMVKMFKTIFLQVKNVLELYWILDHDPSSNDLDRHLSSDQHEKRERDISGNNCSCQVIKWQALKSLRSFQANPTPTW